MSTRLRYNFITGTITSLAGTTLTFSNATGLGTVGVVSGSSYLPLVINPATYGSTSNSEIVYVIAYTDNSNTATVLRGQEGTSALAGTSWPSNTIYSHGSLSSDFTVTSGMRNGDFPTPTASGQILVATSGGISNPVWSSTIPTTVLSGTISASGVVGVLNNATISGSAVVSNILATQISGGALQSSTTISGAQVYGYAGNLTISGSQINGNITSTISGNKVYGDLSANATISGNKIYGDLSANSTISGSRVYGDLSANATISGNKIVSNILATQISGGALQSSVTISGTQIVTGTVPLSAIVSGSAGQVLVTNSGGAVAWANPIAVYNPTYNTNFPIGDNTNPAQCTGPTVSGFSTYMIVTKGTVVASGTNGGSFNFNIEPGLNIGNAPPYGTPAWQGASEIYRVNFNTVLNSTTFFDQRIATGLDPSQALVSYVQMYVGNVNGTLQTSTGYTVYIKVYGIA